MKKVDIKKSVLAGLFSAVTVGVLALLTYKTEFGLFLITSFGSSMVLLFGYPESIKKEIPFVNGHKVQRHKN